ncbi:MAG TPA: glycerophosphodiester phosphodiesterase family protein, partial [Myxococcaceae bacterium]|nr:glycerophosphodiester phosphodiesterase family protein [Myxococcaceae bacterium]
MPIPDPAPLHSFFHGLKPTLNIAHRGGALIAPENTLAAFQIALADWRADMLELDVHQTRDGVLVVSHDPTVDRCTDGSGGIRDLAFSEVARRDAGYRFSLNGGTTFPFRGRGLRIPSLEEVFRAFPRARYNIDLKADAPGVVENFAAIVKRENMVARVCCGSDSDALAARVVQALPDCCHFYPQQALTELVLAIRSNQKPPVDDRYHVIDMPLEYQGVRLIDAHLL